MLIYSKILHEPRKKLWLTLMEYVLADMIYQLSTNPKTNFRCTMSKENMAKWIWVSKQAIHKLINKLIEKWLVEKDKKTKYLKHTNIRYDETVNKVYHDSKQSLPQIVNKVYSDSKQSLHNNNIYNNKENNKNNIIEKNFDFFYSSYPVKKWKTNALKSYINIMKKEKDPGYTHKEILQWLEKYKKEIKIQWTQKSYIAHPSTRLNQRRWEDEYNFIPPQSKKQLPPWVVEWLKHKKLEEEKRRRNKSLSVCPF